MNIPEERGDFVTGEDGCSSQDLLILADKLYRRNKEWREQAEQNLSKNCKQVQP